MLSKEEEKLFIEILAKAEVTTAGLIDLRDELSKHNNLWHQKNLVSDLSKCMQEILSSLIRVTEIKEDHENNR